MDIVEIKFIIEIHLACVSLYQRALLDFFLTSRKKGIAWNLNYAYYICY